MNEILMPFLEPLILSFWLVGKTGVLYDKNNRLKYRLPKLYSSFFSMHSNLPDNILIAEWVKKSMYSS